MQGGGRTPSLLAWAELRMLVGAAGDLCQFRGQRSLLSPCEVTMLFASLRTLEGISRFMPSSDRRLVTLIPVLDDKQIIFSETCWLVE